MSLNWELSRVFPGDGLWLWVWVKCCSHVMDTLSTRLNGWDNACQTSTKPTRVSAPYSSCIWETVIIQVTLMKFSWVIGRDSPFSHLFPHVIIYSITWNDSSIFLIYSLCGWNYSHFGHWGLCWLLGPVFFELLTNFPTLWKALGGTSGSILYTLLVPGLDSTLGTEEKLETNVWKNRHDFKCQKVGLNSKNLKKNN